MNLLQSPHVDVVVESIRALGAFAEDNPFLRDYLIDQGAINHIMNLVNYPKTKVQS